jgi:hypothetical protein
LPQSNFFFFFVFNSPILHSPPPVITHPLRHVLLSISSS